MAGSKHFHGARAKVYLHDPVTGLTKLIGVWTSFSFRQSFDVQAAHVLGRHSPISLTTTAVEAVSIDAQGWRVVGNGPFAQGRVANLKNLLTQEYLVLKCHDRQTGVYVATIHGCVPTGFSAGVSSKTLAEMSNSYMGLQYEDENTDGAEASDAVQEGDLNG